MLFRFGGGKFLLLRKGKAGKASFEEKRTCILVRKLPRLGKEKKV